ncbi:MAG: glycosyltransferase [Candidatus Pacearchaeota archaeon]
MDKLFEISWEVCNKVGGIYTVINSKTNYIKEKFKRYIFIGPYFRNKENPEFEGRETPNEFKEIFEELKNKKIFCFYGIWKTNNTETILIDSAEFMQFKNDIKKKLWEDYAVDSLYSDFWFEEPVIWGYAVGIFLEKVYQKDHTHFIAHFHEWLSGTGILYLKKTPTRISKVFTIHATVIERALAGIGKRIGDVEDIEEEAKQRNVLDKHGIEKQAVINCDIFTTVSDTLAKSAETIFKRKPEVIVLNGLNLPLIGESSPKKSRKRIKEIIMSSFSPYYYINFEKTFLFFISGRYEFHGKGIDILIKALGRLNKKLIEEKSRINIICFFLIPINSTNKNENILRNLSKIKNIKEEVIKKEDILEPFIEFLFNPYEDCNKLREIFSEVKLIKEEGNPKVSTSYFESNEIIRNFYLEGLDNKEENQVKVLFHPNYIEEKDELTQQNYYGFTSGFDLGIFPSFYEPWGYTPLESITCRVPTIASNESGFGDYLLKKYGEEECRENAVTVLKRKDKTEEQIIEEMTKELYNFCKTPREIIIQMKRKTQNLAKEFSWSELIENYVKTYDLAKKIK